MTTAQPPTVRSVNAALRKAGITLYKRPKAQRTHNGQLVQSIGWYGVKTDQWDASTVRITSFSPNLRKAEAGVARIVAALPGYTCQIDRRFGISLMVTAGQ